jgi:hypothetical protein
MVRSCIDCGCQFEAKGTWMRLCWDCWRDRKDRDLEAAAYSRGYVAGLRDGHSQPARSGHGQLDSGLLRALVLLCHPDRHPPERFELANRATATLLGLLEDTR